MEVQQGMPTAQDLNANQAMSVPWDKRKVPSKPYLLFDAGGTLVFPDQPFLIQQAKAHGIEFTQEQLFNGYYELIYTLDSKAYIEGSDFPCDPWPQGYARVLLENMGFGGPAVDAINRSVQARHKQESLWAFTFDWIPQTLNLLAKQGYRMSVISNSDNHTLKTLRKVGLTHYFDCVLSSRKLGIAKPDPRIFEKALRELNPRPTEALYIGDIFEVDVRGANMAGIGGIHLDPLGLYTGWPGVHLPDIRALPEWLIRYAGEPSSYDLFPFGHQSRNGTRVEDDDTSSAGNPVFQKAFA